MTKTATPKAEKIVKEEETLEQPALKSRLITCTQSTGRCGKSTAIEAIISWCGFAGIPIAATDCDAEHKTLSKRFPEASFYDATADKGSLLTLLQNLPSEPVIFADFPAQATDFLLGNMLELRALDILESRGIRLTVLLFAADDDSAKTSLAKTLRAFEQRVDYILVRNPARFSSAQFDLSAAASLLKSRGAATIDLPAITKPTLTGIETASRTAKRHLTLADAAKDKSIELGSRFEIEGFLNRVYTQCEDAAHLLLPDVSLIQNKVHRTPAAKKADFDEFDPLSGL